MLHTLKKDAKAVSANKVRHGCSQGLAFVTIQKFVYIVLLVSLIVFTGSHAQSGLLAEHYPGVPVILIADAAGGYGAAAMSITHKAWNAARRLCSPS